MTITNSPFYKGIQNTYTLSIGKLYFFDNFVVAELNEGVSIGLDTLQEALHLIHDYFGNSNFGIIANRINSYALKVTDATLFNDAFTNLKAYAVVTYTAFAEKIYEIENQFFEFNRGHFKNIEDATHWVEKELKLASDLTIAS